jgi:peptidoglycan/LPS O-acetylase OafA/YrhL
VNITAIPTSIQPTASVSRKPLALVYVVMAVLSFGIAAALEFGGLRSPDIADAGIVPFLLTVIAGALAAWVASFGAGLLGGTLTGFAYALGGGIVQIFSPGSDMPLPAVLVAVLLMTIFGAVLGSLGALPFALMKWRREKNRVRQY